MGHCDGHSLLPGLSTLSHHTHSQIHAQEWTGTWLSLFPTSGLKRAIMGAPSLGWSWLWNLPNPPSLMSLPLYTWEGSAGSFSELWASLSSWTQPLASGVFGTGALSRLGIQKYLSPLEP